MTAIAEARSCPTAIRTACTTTVTVAIAMTKINSRESWNKAVKPTTRMKPTAVSCPAIGWMVAIAPALSAIVPRTTTRADSRRVGHRYRNQGAAKPPTATAMAR